LSGSAYHPRAFLALRRNRRRGLVSRTKIISLLERGKALTAKDIARMTGLTYGVALHHLHLLEDEHITTREGKRPYLWRLTGAGQASLIDLIEK